MNIFLHSKLHITEVEIKEKILDEYNIIDAPVEDSDAAVSGSYIYLFFRFLTTIIKVYEINETANRTTLTYIAYSTFEI